MSGQAAVGERKKPELLGLGGLACLTPSLSFGTVGFLMQVLLCLFPLMSRKPSVSRESSTKWVPFWSRSRKLAWPGWMLAGKKKRSVRMRL